jgi:hypothetical protein
MKERIYLIGQISADKEITYRWRQDVRGFFRQNKMFEIIDPCDNEFNKSVKKFDSSVSRGLTVYNTKGIGLIVPKDYNYVLRSTGCIADLNHYDTDKPMIGTMFELAWYYQNPEKYVIGVFEGDNTSDAYCNHPFVNETVDVWCKNHMEAVLLLKDYYTRSDY